MNPFELVAVLGVAVLIYKLILLGAKMNAEEKRMKLPADELVERLEKIEKRLENLETIVIERSKKEEFERL